MRGPGGLWSLQLPIWFTAARIVTIVVVCFRLPVFEFSLVAAGALLPLITNYVSPSTQINLRAGFYRKHE